MSDSLTAKNAVAAIRVSTTKQGTNGDSPEAQKEQIERFAETKGIVIKKYFVFLESASKAQQPMQEAIDYCKDPKNKVELFIIKSIDRFTRGGSLSYDLLKNQLDACQVSLVDIYGVISATQVNTMEYLGLEYKWSIYSPSKKSEILEAERSKDELRDIMSRMIGAEVRYTRMGYWMRRPPYGYTSEKIDTQNGKRTILRPHPEESKYIIKMFELRAAGRYTDREIVELWRQRQQSTIELQKQRLEHREQLQNEVRATVDRMRVVTSETALKYLEKDIVSVESELEQVDKEIQEQPDLELEFNEVLAYAKYILEHLSEMLLDLCDPLRKAAFFGAIFNKVPTYTEIDLRAHEKARYQR